MPRAPNPATLAMDSTIIQSHHKNPSASKLPIKRKTPDPNPPQHEPNHHTVNGAAPPFKFHRIWTEPDEIRFLQGLLDCSSQNLAFPRDLGIFYDRFSNTMLQPYTKSQLSEKLRRLRKKFRVISTRLSKGLDRSQLSVHDRALYDLSKRLWHPEFAATSPFSGARNVGLNHSTSGGEGDGKLKQSSLVGVKVDFSPILPKTLSGFDHDHDGDDANLELDCFDNENGCNDEGVLNLGDCYDNNNNNGNDEFKLSEVNVELEGEAAAMEADGGDIFRGGIQMTEQKIDFSCENKIGEIAAKVVVNVFDECFKEARRLLAGGCGDKVGAESFHLRWQQQRIAELDVLGSRLRLVLEHSLGKH